MSTLRRILLAGSDNFPDDWIIYYNSDEKASVKNMDVLKHVFANGEGKIICKKTIVEIPSSSLQANAFKAYTLPPTVKTIGYNAFEYCPNLTAINITDNITRVDGSAFGNCPNVKNIVISGADKTLSSCFYGTGGELVINCKVEGTNIFWKSNITKAHIGSQTSVIDREWFSEAKFLEEVVIEEGVKTIGKNAFYLCESLRSINIPQSITDVAQSAFISCTSLPIKNDIRCADSIAVSFYNKTAESYNFEGYRFIMEECRGASECTALHIPDSIIQIHEGALTACEKLVRFTGKYVTESGRAIVSEENSGTLLAYAVGSGTDYQLEGSINRIGNYAFSTATLNNFTIDDNVKEIGDYAFNSAVFDTLIIPATVDKFGYRCFYRASANEVIYRNKMEDQSSSWGLNGDYGYNKFKKLRLERVGGETYIGKYFFSHWNELESVEISMSSVTIRDNAFQSCSKLKEIIFDNFSLVVSFKNYCFNGCSALEIIDLRGVNLTNSNVPTITPSSFYGLPSTCKIVVRDAVYDEYVTATNWSTYADQIVKASEYTGS